MRAAACSACFFERPSPVPCSWPPTDTRAVKRLAWSGPSDDTEYDGSSSKRRAASSWSRVLKSWPPGPAAASVMRSPSRSMTSFDASSHPPSR